MASTRHALSYIELGSAPDLLDIACGPGMQTLHLAEALTAGTLTAVDLRKSFVNEARRRCASANLKIQVDCQIEDMTDLPFESGSFDLIWCEGAAYIMGVENALRSWRPLLRDGGYLAFSEATWLREPHSYTKEWWTSRYPGMRANHDWLPTIRECGYDVIEYFPLPDEDWWADYYNSLQSRIVMLTDAHPDNAILSEAQSEIDLRREYPDDYSYTFYILRKSTQS